MKSNGLRLADCNQCFGGTCRSGLQGRRLFMKLFASVLKVEALSSSETLVSSSQRRIHNRENFTLHNPTRRN